MDETFEEALNRIFEEIKKELCPDWAMICDYFGK